MWNPLLMVSKPAQGWPAGGIGKDGFQEAGRVHQPVVMPVINCRLILNLRVCCIHFINFVQSTGVIALTCMLMTLGGTKKTSPIWDKLKKGLSRNPVMAILEPGQADASRRVRVCGIGIF